MGLVGLFALYAGAYIISQITASAAGKHNIEADRYFAPDAFPVAEEGHQIPLLYGTTREVPKLHWYGGTFAIPIKEQIGDENFGGEKVTIAVAYGGSFMFVLGIGNGSADGGRRALKLWMADKLVWSGSATTDGQEYDISDGGANHTLWGGRGQGGGVASLSVLSAGPPIVYGGLRFWNGGSVHPANDHMGALLEAQGVIAAAADLPRFNGWAYMYLESVTFGENPQLPVPSIEYRNIPSRLSASPTIDCNPADVIYDMLTQDLGRLGDQVGSANVDLTSFQAAAATLESEGQGFSAALHGPVRTCIQQVCNQIDGIVYQNRAGQIAIKLVRNDYTPAALPLFNKSNCQVRQWSTTDWDDTFNEVIGIYKDRDADYKVRAYREQSDASIAIRGRRPIEIKYPGVKTRTLVRKLCARDLLTLSVPNVYLEIACNREASVLETGDVFRFTWDFEGYSINQMVFRVEDVDLGAYRDGTVIVKASRDKYDRQSPLMDIDPVDAWDPPNVQPAAATVFRADELPLWMGYKAELAGKINDRYAAYLRYCAKVPGSIEQFFAARASLDSGSTYAEDAAYQDFTPYAELETAYARETGPYDTTVGLRFDTFDFDVDAILGSATATEIRQHGKNLALIDEEIIAFESISGPSGGVYTLNNVWRGLLDTVPTDHAVNAKIWFIGIAGLEPIGSARWDGWPLTPPSIDYHIIPSTGLQSLDPDDATDDTIAIVDRALLPLPVADMYVDGLKAGGTVYENEVLVQGKPRDRLQTQISRGDEASEHGDVDSTHRYDVNGRIGAAGYTDDLVDNQTPTAINDGVLVPLQLLGAGVAELQIESERDIDETLLGATFRESFQSPTVKFNLPEYRQLLRNPSFDNATNGEFWTTESGTPIYSSLTAEVIGGQGKSYYGGPSGASISQTVNVLALSPVGGDVLFTWHQTNLNSDADDRMRVTIHALDAGDSSLGNVTTGWIVPTADVWHDNELAYNNLPSGTEKLQVILDSDEVGGSGLDCDAAFDCVGLYFCTEAAISADQLSNEDFETTGSWTTDSGTWDYNLTDDQVTGAASAECSGEGEGYQEISIPGGFGAGDVAWLTGWRKCDAGETCQVTLEAREVGVGVEATSQTAFDEVTGWTRVNLYVTLTADTDAVRVTLAKGVDDGGVAYFDNMLLRFIDQTA